jgi:hypothetical protein
VSFGVSVSGGGADVEEACDFAEGHAGLAQKPDFMRRGLAKPFVEVLHSVVSGAVFAVLYVGIPSEIAKPVVRLDVVHMATLHPGGPGPDKGLKHHVVNPLVGIASCMDLPVLPVAATSLRPEDASL